MANSFFDQNNFSDKPIKASISRGYLNKKQKLNLV